MDEFRKFINSILHERTATPFYTTFLISWLLWNWRPLYVTLFISESYISGNKLDYIIPMFGWWVGLVFPLISTALIIFGLSYVANITYRFSLRRRRERINDKIEIIEKDRSMTFDQVAELKTEWEKRIQNVQREVETLTNQKQILEIQIDNQNSKISRLESQGVEKEEAFRSLFYSDGGTEIAPGYILIKAFYGSFNKIVDVTDSFLSRFQKGKDFKVTNENLGVENDDPDRGRIKQLVLLIRGKKVSDKERSLAKVDSIIVLEGQTLLINTDGTSMSIK